MAPSGMVPGSGGGNSVSGNNSVILKVGPCGGSEGHEQDMDLTGVTRIRKIVIWYGDFVDAISVEYERNGQVESFKWGGNAGTQAPPLILEPSEYIKSLSGKIGLLQRYTVVSSLAIETSKRKYGPYGGSGGAPFNLPAMNNEKIRGEIIGFHGRPGGVLDAIGVYIKLSPVAMDSPAMDPPVISEEKFQLYLHYVAKGPDRNETISVQPNDPNGFGVITITDWTIRESRFSSSKLIARAQGMRLGTDQNLRGQSTCSLNMLFVDGRFKGSALVVMGGWDSRFSTDWSTEWAITGGTGQFTLAQGMIYGNVISSDFTTMLIAELNFRVFYRKMKN